MNLETEYVEYGIELSIAVLGVSAAYFIDFSNPATFLSLVFMPLLFGYTTYISKEGFNHASLTSMTTLVFTLLGGVTAVVAVIYSLGNILVSVLSGGTQFKDFYGATSIPLLVTGLVIGSFVFGYGTLNPDYRAEKVSHAGQKMGELSQTTFEDSGLLENQKKAQLRTVNQTARTAVSLTAQKLYNKSNPSNEVRMALMSAETQVPKQLYSRTKEIMEEQSVDISGRVSGLFEENFSGNKFILVIPLIAGFFYSMQPIIGLLTGLFAKIFLLFDN